MSKSNSNAFAGFRIRLQAQRGKTGDTYDGPLTGGVALFATVADDDQIGQLDQPDFPAVLPAEALSHLRSKLDRVDSRDLPEGRFELISVKATARGWVGNYRIPEDLSALFAGAVGSGMKAREK